MPICENREYRSMPVVNIESRAEDKEPSFFVEGYASTFDEYELFQDKGTTYNERIEPTAFDECDMSDVVFQKDHTGTVMARTSNGTITLDIDEHGLHQRTDLSKTEAARQMYEEIKAEMYTRMSFAFIVAKDRVERKDKNTVVRVIEKIAKLYDVSAVSFPANAFTDIGLSNRSAFDGFIEREAQELRKKEKDERLAKAKEEYWRQRNGNQ